MRALRRQLTALKTGLPMSSTLLLPLLLLVVMSAWLLRRSAIDVEPLSNSEPERTEVYPSWAAAFAQNGSTLATLDAVFSHGFIHRSAYVLLIDQKGRVLMQQRTMQMRSCPGSQTVGLGEGCRPSEDWLACAQRGVAEEFGVRLPPERFAKAGDYRWMLEVKRQQGMRIDRSAMALFCARLDTAQLASLRPDPGEVENTEFISLEEAQLSLRKKRKAHWCSDGYRSNLRSMLAQLIDHGACGLRSVSFKSDTAVIS
jgi:isopentenyldiphosphate isomerase